LPKFKSKVNTLTGDSENVPRCNILQHYKVTTTEQILGLISTSLGTNLLKAVEAELSSQVQEVHRQADTASQHEDAVLGQLELFLVPEMVAGQDQVAYQFHTTKTTVKTTLGITVNKE